MQETKENSLCWNRVIIFQQFEIKIVMALRVYMS